MTADAAFVRSVQRRTVRTLSASQVLTGIGIAVGVAAGGLLVADVTGSEGLAGLAQTSGVVGAALAAVPLARTSARHGRRRGLALGLAMAVVGSLVVLAGAATSAVAVLLLGMLLVGAATAVGLQVRYASTDLAEPDHAARALSMVVWATTVGAVLGPALMQSAADLAVPLGLPALAGPYLVTAAALTLAFLVIVVALRPDPLLLVRGRQAGETEQVKVGFVASLRIVGRSPSATYGLLALTVGHCAMVMVMVMTPVYMQHVDVTLRVIGLVISVHILGMYAFSPVVGVLTDRWGARGAIAVGAGVLLAATLLAGTAPGDDTWRLGGGLFLLGLGWSFTLIAGSALLSVSVAEDVRPAVQGAGDTVMNGSAAVAGALAGLVVAVGGYGWLNLLAAVLVLGLLVLGVSSGLRTPVRLQS